MLFMFWLWLITIGWHVYNKDFFTHLRSLVTQELLLSIFIQRKPRINPFWQKKKTYGSDNGNQPGSFDFSLQRFGLQVLLLQYMSNHTHSQFIYVSYCLFLSLALLAVVGYYCNWHHPHSLGLVRYHNNQCWPQGWWVVPQDVVHCQHYQGEQQDQAAQQGQQVVPQDV